MTDIEAKNLLLLARALSALESPDEIIAFLRELCTSQETRSISQRLGIAELLMQGIPQRMIGGMLCNGDAARRPSTATISRVSDVVKNGNGHLCRVIARANGVEGR